MSTAIALSGEQMDKALEGITIPPQPAILTALMKERNKPEPSMQNIAAIVSRDVGMSAAVLKTINSPFYGMRREIDSIAQAINLLGLQNIVNLVTALSLRRAMTSKSAEMEKYWENSTHVALVAVMMSKRLSVAKPDEAYTLGLFHDCGIPLLVQKFADYFQTTQQAAASCERSITDIEDEKYTTNHAVIGFYLCRSWGISETIRESVLVHHDCSKLLSDEFSVEVNQLIGVLKLAEHIVHTYNSMNDDQEWASIRVKLLDYFGLMPDDFDDLMKDAHDYLDESSR